MMTRMPACLQRTMAGGDLHPGGVKHTNNTAEGEVDLVLGKLGGVVKAHLGWVVFLLSPVIMITRIPACLQRTMAGATSILGGSSIPTTPQKVRLTSYLANLEESSRLISDGFMGESAVARQRHLRVSRPVPYSIALAMMASLILGVMGTFSVPILTYVHLSRTPSGAPLTKSLGPFPRRVGFLGVQYEDIDFLSLLNSRV